MFQGGGAPVREWPGQMRMCKFHPIKVGIVAGWGRVEAGRGGCDSGTPSSEETCSFAKLPLPFCTRGMERPDNCCAHLPHVETEAWQGEELTGAPCSDMQSPGDEQRPGQSIGAGWSRLLPPTLSPWPELDGLGRGGAHRSPDPCPSPVGSDSCLARPGHPGQQCPSAQRHREEGP